MVQREVIAVILFFSDFRMHILQLIIQMDLWILRLFLKQRVQGSIPGSNILYSNHCGASNSIIHSLEALKCSFYCNSRNWNSNSEIIFWDLNVVFMLIFFLFYTISWGLSSVFTLPSTGLVFPLAPESIAYYGTGSIEEPLAFVLLLNQQTIFAERQIKT